MKGNLGGVGRFRKPTRDVGAPRISHCKKLLLPPGPEEVGWSERKGCDGNRITTTSEDWGNKRGAACWEL